MLIPLPVSSFLLYSLCPITLKPNLV
jgi:hypothetical protein